jgi:hypothetical protein
MMTISVLILTLNEEDYELMLRFLVRYKITSAYLSEIIIKMRSGGGEQRLSHKPPSGQSDGPAGVEGERPQPISLDPLDEAVEKGRAVS